MEDCGPRVRVCGLHLAGVESFVLHHIRGEHGDADPGLGHVVTQLGHAEDPRLHQAPAGTTDSLVNIIAPLSLSFMLF